MTPAAQVQAPVDLFSATPQSSSQSVKASDDLLQLNPFVDVFTQNAATMNAYTQLNAVPMGNGKLFFYDIY